MNVAMACRALVTRYAPNTAMRLQSLMSAILNALTLLLELTAHETELDEWKETVSGDRFNASMKKALFVDKASTNVLAFQMQNLGKYEEVHQFLQHNSQNLAGVAVNTNRKRGDDDMEIDALTTKASS